MREMIELGKDNFEAEVATNTTDTIFIDFYGDGCVPCKALMPKVHEYAEKYGDKMKFCAFNTTKARRLAISLKILGLPTMAIFKNGEKIDEIVKEDCTEESIEAFIKKYYDAL